VNALISPVRRALGAASDAVPTRLPDGRIVTLRPLRRGERAPLLTVFEGMSSASRARRYLTGMVRLPSTMLDALTDVDGHRHVAWLASMDGRAVGIARTVQDDTGAADVAVEVVDDRHGLGIASALVDAVTTVAAARGVHRVRASLTPDNQPSRRLVTRIGVRLQVSGDLLEGEGRLRLMHPPRVDRQAVLTLALGMGTSGTAHACRPPGLNATSTACSKTGGSSHTLRKEIPCPPPTSITPRP
jgi:acetyltransferase